MQSCIHSFLCMLLVNECVHLNSVFGFTDHELELINQFKGKVNNDLTLDFMHRDEYLAHWLSVNNWKMADALSVFKKSRKWRNDNQIDTILDEPMPLCNQYPLLSSDMVNKRGEPVVILWFGKWDVRKTVISGKSKEFLRCVYRYWEHMNRRVWNQNKLLGTNNITQFDTISDDNGFNLRQHACVQCITLMADATKKCEENYPLMIGKLIVINVNEAVKTLLEVVKKQMSAKSRVGVNIYGFDKQKWQEALLKNIDADQLPVEFGGTKIIKKP